MSGPTCATCRHYFPERDQPRDVPDFGRCHRYPESRSAGVLHWCGEHTPAEPVGVTVSAPELPDGWRWRDDRAVGPNDDAVFIDEDGDLAIIGRWYAPIAAVKAVIAAHRARGVR